MIPASLIERAATQEHRQAYAAANLLVPTPGLMQNDWTLNGTELD